LIILFVGRPKGRNIASVFQAVLMIYLHVRTDLDDPHLAQLMVKKPST